MENFDRQTANCNSVGRRGSEANDRDAAVIDLISSGRNLDDL